MFQLVNDAYYTLSDPARRRDYDTQRRLFGQTGGDTSDEDTFNETGGTAGGGPQAQRQQNSYSWAWNFFTGQGGDQAHTRQEAENAQFGDVFEEMLREEGMADPRNGPANEPVLEHGRRVERWCTGLHRCKYPRVTGGGRRGK